MKSYMFMTFINLLHRLCFFGAPYKKKIVFTSQPSPVPPASLISDPVWGSDEKSLNDLSSNRDSKKYVTSATQIHEPYMILCKQTS